MISNIWNDIKIVCGCHDNKQIPLEPHAGSSDFVQGGYENSMFYSCPKYYPENREPGERPCFNRLSIGEFETLVNHISDLLEEEENMFGNINLAGHTWKNKYGTVFKILKHTKDGIIVSVINKKSVRIRT